MANSSSTVSEDLELPAEERARIRAEMRYAMLVAQAGRPAEKPRTAAESILSYLSNGFVLLLVGSLITSALVPYFQREYESRTRRSALKQECFSQFLLYSNSIWQEYYAILPATLQTDMDKDEYVKYKNEISQIKLKRYDAYAKVLALALAFRESSTGIRAFLSRLLSRVDAVPDTASPVEAALHNYATEVNAVSEKIDTWLHDLYCTPTKRAKSPCEIFDPAFVAYQQYEAIKTEVNKLGNERTQEVAGMIVQKIKSPD